MKERSAGLGEEVSDDSFEYSDDEVSDIPDDSQPRVVSESDEDGSDSTVIDELPDVVAFVPMPMPTQPGYGDEVEEDINIPRASGGALPPMPDEEDHLPCTAISSATLAAIIAMQPNLWSPEGSDADGRPVTGLAPNNHGAAAAMAEVL